MKKYTINKIVLRFIGILLFVILWEVFSLIIGERTFIFPGPIETIKEVITMLKSIYIYECIGITMTRMLAGFVISFVVAFILGVIAGNYTIMEELIKPSMSIFRSVPTACLVYLFLVIAGARLTPLYIVILISLPILYENILGGIKATPKAVLKASKLDGADFISKNIMIRIPLALPYIVVGITSTFGLALKIEIMAEVITGYTRLGLGSAILAAQRSDPTNMVPVFAYGLIGVALILIIDTICDAIRHKYM